MLISSTSPWLVRNDDQVVHSIHVIDILAPNRNKLNIIQLQLISIEVVLCGRHCSQRYTCISALLFNPHSTLNGEVLFSAHFAGEEIEADSFPKITALVRDRARTLSNLMSLRRWYSQILVNILLPSQDPYRSEHKIPRKQNVFANSSQSFHHEKLGKLTSHKSKATFCTCCYTEDCLCLK